MSPVFYRHDLPHVPRSGGGGPRNLPRVELEILRGRAQNRLRPVKVPAFLIGSATDCDLVLGDSRFPEAHSYLLLSPGEVALRWLGCGPQVAVNGESIQKSRLCDGDHLRMGPYEFRISIRLVEPAPDSVDPQILRLNRIPPDDLNAAGREIRGLLAEIRQAAPLAGRIRPRVAAVESPPPDRGASRFAS
jgi:predicted component of type VI protein secretion system